MIPTKEEIIDFVGIHPLKVKNIYMFGSRIYGTAREDSDYDFILVGSAQIARDEKKSKRLNVHIHTTDVFKEDLYKHDIHNLECFYAPDSAILQLKEPFSDFKIVPNRLKKSVLAESYSSWNKARMSIRDGNSYRGVKSLWHSLRMLMFAQDILENGRITHWDIANPIWNELKDCDEYEWSYYKEKYFQLKVQLEERLKIS